MVGPMRAALALVTLLAATALAGCSGSPGQDDSGNGPDDDIVDDTDSATDSQGSDDGDDGGDTEGSPAPETEFTPDLAALSQEFCSTLNVTLPAPRFDELRFEGREDRLYDGPLPCEVWNDPDSTEEERRNASVSIEVTRVFHGEQELALDRDNVSFSGMLFGEMSLYGHVGLLAPEGSWGEAGSYELEYGPVYDEAGNVIASTAQLRKTPQGYHL